MENNVPFGYDLNGQNEEYGVHKVTLKSMAMAEAKAKKDKEELKWNYRQFASFIKQDIHGESDSLEENV